MIKKNNLKFEIAVFVIAILLLTSITSVITGVNNAKNIQRCMISECKKMVSFFDNNIVMDYSFSFPAPDVTQLVINDTVYHQVTMDGLYTVGYPNTPLLPVKPYSIIIPQMYEVDSINVTWQNNVSLGDGFNVEIEKTEALSSYTTKGGLILVP